MSFWRRRGRSAGISTGKISRGRRGGRGGGEAKHFALLNRDHDGSGVQCLRLTIPLTTETTCSAGILVRESVELALCMA